MSPTTGQREAVDFLVELFGEAPSPDARIALWKKRTRGSDLLVEPAAAADFEGQIDVYVGAALSRPEISGKRPSAEDAVGIPGVWADIDVNGGPQEKTGAAPDLKAATELASAIQPPTVLVHSGYGVQAWWLFPEPWIFDGADQRERAAQIVKGWQELLRRQADFSIDSTHDLARLMRLPGTYNGKGTDPAHVEVRVDEGPRYSIEDLGELALAVAAPTLPSTNGKVEVGDQVVDLPRAKFNALCENVDGFEATWEHTRRGKAKGWSMSEHDFALASFALHARWSDAEVRALIVAHREHHGDPDGKAGRADYLERTIAKAKKGTPAASSEPTGPVLVDPHSGEQLTALQKLNREIQAQGGNAEILAVTQVGQQDAQWYFTVRSRRTGEPVELKSLETKKLETLSNLSARVREADGGRMPRPRAGNEKHGALMDAIDEAKEVQETGATEETTWRRHLARYVEMRGLTAKGVNVRDIADPDQKRGAIENPHPFEGLDGRLQVNAGNWLSYLEDNRIRDVTEPAVTSALRRLGFERQEQLSAKFSGVTATKRFWRAPANFDWRSES